MAANSDAKEARKAQDVETPVHHDKEKKGTYHWGRGGEGNMMTVGKDSTSEKKERSGSFKDKLDKGKEMLGLKGKTGDKGGNGSAIADE